MGQDPRKQFEKDDWGGGGQSSSKDDWGGGGHSSTKDDWGGGGQSSSKDDWGGGGHSSTKDDWGGGGQSSSKDDWGGGGGGRSSKKDDWGGGGQGSSKDNWGGGGRGGRRPNNNRNQEDSSRKRFNKDDWGGGGQSSTKDDWGGGGQSSTKDDWGGGGGGGGRRPNNDRNQEDPSRKRFKKDDWGDGGQKSNNDGDQEERPAPFKPDELNLEEEAKLQGDGAGENFHRYNDQKVTCLPIDIIGPVENFEDIITSKLLLANIKSQRYSEMTPIQKWTMPAIMESHDLIGCAQTGSGKTAAFLLPVLQTLLNMEIEPNDPNSDCQNPYCLIISPTRELANQIYVHANMLSKDSIIKCRVMYGQISTAHLKYQLTTGCHILVATPGRLKDFVQRGWIGFKNIKFVILDEGDRLVDEGFTSDIKSFFDHESMPPKDKRQTLFFSATFKEGTQLSAKEYLKDDFIFLTVGRIGAANEDIKQEFLQVSRQEKKRELKKILAEVPEADKCIVFTQTKSAADMLAGFFNVLNLSSTSIHGDRHQSQREQAIRAFRKGEKRFLISSPVGNRGLDLPKVAIVINYDLPSNIDEYVHRIGRTGRAGHSGRAISFYDAERDRELLPDLIEILKEAKQEIPSWLTDDPMAISNNNGEANDWSKEAANGAQISTAQEDWNSTTDNKPAETASADDAW